MSGEGGDEDEGGSQPCLLSELDADGRPGADPRQQRDVARWRKVERERLLALRQSLDADARSAATDRMATELDRLLPPGDSTLISVYWPIRAEPDFRPWMQQRARLGTRIALPIATALGEPLRFREWHPGARLARGLWGIPYPAEGDEVIPDVVLAPLVGFDEHHYRLGYGGGFFDRTLAALHPRPRAIGVGYPCTAIRTIFPQPYDIPMDLIVTGDEPGRSRP